MLIKFKFNQNLTLEKITKVVRELKTLGEVDIDLFPEENVNAQENDREDEEENVDDGDAEVNGCGNFSLCHFDHKNLSLKNLKGANFYRASLFKAILTKADLRYADLREADIREANFQYADLRFANLTGATLSDTNFKGALRHPDDHPILGWKVVNGKMEKA